MPRNRSLYSLVIILVSVWWAWTFLVDVFIVRTIFRTIDNFFQAGDLGMAVFTALNNLELIVSTAIVSLLSYQLTKNRKTFTLLILSLIAWVIPMTYYCYLTPKLSYLTEIWKHADLISASGVKEITDIQQTHQFYHNIYIAMDTGKLILLTIILGIAVIKEKKWT